MTLLRITMLSVLTMALTACVTAPQPRLGYRASSDMLPTYVNGQYVGMQPNQSNYAAPGGNAVPMPPQTTYSQPVTTVTAQPQAQAQPQAPAQPQVNYQAPIQTYAPAPVYVQQVQIQAPIYTYPYDPYYYAPTPYYVNPYFATPLAVGIGIGFGWGGHYHGHRRWRR